MDAADFGRYRPQMALPEIGKAGQQKLRDASVLVVGAGGLGNTVLAILNAMGVGNLGIADYDKISHSNLHRQFLYQASDIGHAKTLTLAAGLNRQNPSTFIKTFNEGITSANAESVIREFGLVCDCTDNLETRLILNKACSALQKPLIFGVASGFEGYVTILHGPAQISLEDLSGIYAGAGNDCAVSGIFSPVVSTIGSLQASETVKLILGKGELLDGRILCVDLLNNVFRIFKLIRSGVTITK